MQMGFRFRSWCRVWKTSSVGRDNCSAMRVPAAHPSAEPPHARRRLCPRRWPEAPALGDLADRSCVPLTHGIWLQILGSRQQSSWNSPNGSTAIENGTFRLCHLITTATCDSRPRPHLAGTNPPSPLFQLCLNCARAGSRGCQLPGALSYIAHMPLNASNLLAKPRTLKLGSRF